ncbi:unnamed protein product [Amoebophrya sp. A120]|nr:unnamed protein product [Amoebophrya sp. A120]|eukprot:GSA120T00012903001.1
MSLFDRWVEQRAARCVADLRATKAQLQDQLAATRIANTGNRGPPFARHGETLRQLSGISKKLAQVEADLQSHTVLKAAADRGASAISEEKAADLSRGDFFKRNWKIVGVSWVEAVPTSASGKVASAYILEAWGRDNTNNQLREQALPVGAGWSKSRGWDALSKSLRQDQILEMWIAAVPALCTRTMAAELFVAISSFLSDPVEDVLLNAESYCRRARSARAQQLRPQMQYLLQMCEEEAAEGASSLVGQAESRILFLDRGRNIKPTVAFSGYYGTGRLADADQSALVQEVEEWDVGATNNIVCSLRWRQLQEQEKEQRKPVRCGGLTGLKFHENLIHEVMRNFFEAENGIKFECDKNHLFQTYDRHPFSLSWK